MGEVLGECVRVWGSIGRGGVEKCVMGEVLGSVLGCGEVLVEGVGKCVGKWGSVGGGGEVLGEVWGSVLGCGRSEKICGEVSGRHGKPQNTSLQPPHLPNTFPHLPHTPTHFFSSCPFFFFMFFSLLLLLPLFVIITTVYVNVNYSFLML